jgi:hypothetical protein
MGRFLSSWRVQNRVIGSEVRKNRIGRMEEWKVGRVGGETITHPASLFHSNPLTFLQFGGFNAKKI